VPEADLADLLERPARTRRPGAETVDDWSRGMPLSYARELCEYRRTSYDWRAAEARLNAVPRFRTEIDGLSIHFLHARSPHPGTVPLLTSHGWPGSAVEFPDVIEPLTAPADPADAFHVLCPSLPGFGFSGKPAGTGWTAERTAAAWAALMARLGYGRYAAHGVDRGSFITAIVGETDAEHLAGICPAMPFARPPRRSRWSRPSATSPGRRPRRGSSGTRAAARRSGPPARRPSDTA
jgi:pimeloyl-ACP methyl ester carboxylesterase